ncbi:MAG: hypothetical protein IPG06_25800 [Haliea sp.]|nr:hypothetical protein [Haliea sp.]
MALHSETIALRPVDVSIGSGEILDTLGGFSVRPPFGIALNDCEAEMLGHSRGVPRKVFRFQKRPINRKAKSETVLELPDFDADSRLINPQMYRF